MLELLAMDLIKTIDENEEVENLSEDSDAEIEVRLKQKSNLNSNPHLSCF